MKAIYLYSLMGGVLLTGTFGTIISKAMNEESAKGYPFHHPYFQSALMFLGEAMCFAVYKLYSTLDPSVKSSFSIDNVVTNSDKVINKLGKFVYMFPTLFDLISSSMSYLGLIFIAPSVYQMLRGFVIVIVALFSVVFLKKKLFRHQIVGCVLATLGVMAVGVVSILYQAASASNPVMGAVLIIVAQFFTGGMFVVEELFFSKVKVDPLHAVGLEGFFGVSYFCVLLPIFYFIPCDLDFCMAGKLEDSVLAFEQIGTNSMIAIFAVITAINLAVYNWTGIATTKYASSLSRSTLQTAKTILVWICSILLGWEVFLWPQLIGFVVIAIGTMIYNEVIVIPLFGLKESVERKKAKSEDEIRQKLDKSERESYYALKDHSTINYI